MKSASKFSIRRSGFFRNLALATAFCTFFGGSTVLAQDVTLEVALTRVVTEASALSFSELGIDANGQGAKLFDLVIRNNTGVDQGGLRFRITLDASRRGNLVNMVSEVSGFILQGNEIVVANNNSLVDGLPTMSGFQNIDFPGELEDFLTTAGEELYNDTNGKLPDDVYTLTLELFRSGETLSVAQIVLGEEPLQNEVTFFLQQPGADIGSESTINTIYPTFRWEGPTSIDYRLIVVEAKQGRSQQGLLNAAASTEPSIVDGRPGLGSLLEFEIADVLLTADNNSTNNFTLPPNGVQPLEGGKKYYWQIVASVQTSSRVDERPSDIWEFTVEELSNNSAADIQLEINQKLQEYLGQAVLQQLVGDGFDLISLEIDGQTYTGAAIIPALERFKNKVDDGKVTL